MFRYLLILAFFASFIFGSGTAIASASEPESDHTIQLTWGSFDPLATDPEIPTDWEPTGRAAASSSYWLVQFERPLTAVDRDSLQGMNVSLIAYVPQLTYIVHSDATSAEILNTLEWVRWVGEYAPAFRVEPTLADAYETAKSTRQATTAILIMSLFPQADADLISAEIANLGATITSNVSNEWQSAFQIEADLQLLPQLAAIDGVNWIDVLPEAETQNMIATEITGVNAIRETTTIPGLFGAGQVVAVADTGLDLGFNDPAQLHDDFEDGNGNSRVLALYDGAYDGAEDHSGHGTHVAGTIAGNGARSGSDPLNNDFANSQAGVAPQANLIMQAIGGDNGALSGIPWYLPWMFSEAATPINGQSAKIHSNSWGISNSGGLYSSYSVAIDQYMWDNPDFLIIFAAGNEGSKGTGSILAPATSKNVLSVGATESSVESPNILSNYSGRGPTRDGRIKPDLVAPGTVITSTASSQRYNTDYTYYFGTSMATPHVAGAAALVREYLDNNGHSTPSAALVKGMLVNGTRDLAIDARSNVTVTRPTNEAGWGRLDVANSVGVTGNRSVQYWDSLSTDANNQSVALNTGDVATHTVTIYNSAQPLNITLAWTDYPGTTAANGALINDLDLHLVAPDGSILYPNHANSGTIGDNYDHVNNVVGIDVETPQLGVYQLVVRGYNVAMQSQPYALIASGPITGNNNICEQAVDGPGLYSFCNIGVTLDISEISGVDTIRVEVIDTPDNTLVDPSLMLARYYRIT
ncbi:MAG: S8 family serine peptidase, partial [Candidatus Promineifilaceae bacterium]